MTVTCSEAHCTLGNKLWNTVIERIVRCAEHEDQECGNHTADNDDQRQSCAESQLRPLSDWCHHAD